MIGNDGEYRKVIEQLTHLEVWLREVEGTPDHPNKGLTKAGIHKMIARLHEELAVYDAECALAGRNVADGD